MRVVVDYERCESNGVCTGIAPEVFELRDDDMLYLLVEEVDESQRPLLTTAVRQCPRQALRLEG